MATQIEALKFKIEQENVDLEVERDSLLEQLNNMMAEKEALRKSNAVIFQKIVAAKMENITETNVVDNLHQHVEWQKRLIRDLDAAISAELGMASLEASVKEFRQNIEGALNFYSSDSLHYELSRRTELNRNKRVELTRITTEVEEKKRAIEAARLAEQKRLADEERRQAELIKRQEEDRVREAEEHSLKETVTEKAVSKQSVSFLSTFSQLTRW